MLEKLQSCNDRVHPRRSPTRKNYHTLNHLYQARSRYMDCSTAGNDSGEETKTKSLPLQKKHRTQRLNFEDFSRRNGTQPPRSRALLCSRNALLAGRTGTLVTGRRTQAGHSFQEEEKKKKGNICWRERKKKKEETGAALLTHLANVAPHYYFASTDDSILDRSCTIHSVAHWFVIFNEETVREIGAPPSVYARTVKRFVRFLSHSLTKRTLTIANTFVAVCLCLAFRNTACLARRVTPHDHLEWTTQLSPTSLVATGWPCKALLNTLTTVLVECRRSVFPRACARLFPLDLGPPAL